MSLVFDSEPLIAYFIGEPAAAKVVELLNRIYNGDLKAFINIINLSEIYYILHRIDPGMVDEKMEFLRSIGIQITPVEDDDIWKTAAMIKSQHKMSLADAYAAATALATDSTLVIGRDREFNGLTMEKIVLI